MTVLNPPLQMTTMLASGLAAGTHKLEFWRRSEGSYGTTVVSGLVLDPGMNVLSPDSRPPHKIEVLGDSISAGYGDEGTSATVTVQTENGYMAYGPQLARMLDAEWSIVAQSGHGMYQNLCGSPGMLMPDEFKLTFNPDAMPGAPPWNFMSWQTDVLVVLLGTNDFADGGGVCAVPMGIDAPFTMAYENFLTYARSVYPNAEIFAVGTFLSDGSNQFASCANDINTSVMHMNDAHMHFVDPSTAMWLVGPGDYIGDWTHPTVAGHTKIATHLRDIIKPIMGW
jgi:lysophospholipase L1-like esterase